MSTNHPPRLTPLIAAALFAASLLLYTLTLAPSVVTLFDDSLEFQLVTYQLGIAHPTGYPLYTLLGKLFTLLPLGSVAFKVALSQAVAGSVAAVLVYLLVIEAVNRMPIALGELTQVLVAAARNGEGMEAELLRAALSFPQPPFETPGWPVLVTAETRAAIREAIAARVSPTGPGPFEARMYRSIAAHLRRAVGVAG